MRAILPSLIVLAVASEAFATPFAPEGGCVEKNLAAEGFFFDKLEDTREIAPFVSDEAIELFYGLSILQCQTDDLTLGMYQSFPLSERLSLANAQDWRGYLVFMNATSEEVFEFASDCVSDEVKKRCIEQAR